MKTERATGPIPMTPSRLASALQIARRCQSKADSIDSVSTVLADAVLHLYEQATGIKIDRTVP